MRILMWDVHGGYTDALLAGGHEYLFLPPDRQGQGGLSRYGAQAPAGAREVTAAELGDDPPDLVLLQRTDEIAWCRDLLRRQPGRALAAIFLEHNTPRADVPNSRHPCADVDGLLIVHVTYFNQLFWDCGRTRTTVIEHGLADPGLRYTGELPHLAFVVNEPVRRWRVTGTDLLTAFGGHPIDAFGIDGHLLRDAIGPACPRLAFAGNLSPEELSEALAVRRAYLHLNRWTSLGLSLVQAMLLGLPVLVLDTTEASRAVPPAAGAVATDLDELATTARILLADREEAARRGRIARVAALERYGLQRFLVEWDRVFAEIAG